MKSAPCGRLIRPPPLEASPCGLPLVVYLLSPGLFSCDLAAFFDTVDHQKLMGKLRERVADPALLKLIHGYLKAGTIKSKLTREERDEERKERDEGVPQGGPLSPLDNTQP